VYTGDGDGYDENATDWGATYGPDGQPGIKDQVSGAVRDTGTLRKKGIAAQGRAFKVVGRWDHAHTNAVLSTHTFISTDSASSMAALNVIHATDTLRFVVETISPYGNASGNTLYSEDVTGALPTGVATDVIVQGWRSVVTETSPGSGVYAPDTDGFVEVLVDGVQVASFTGPVWNQRDDINPDPYWNQVLVRTVGAFTGWEVWDEVATIRGSFVAGETGTVTATRAALFSLDGAVNTNSTEGLFKVAGDTEVTGTLNVDGEDIDADLSAALDGLTT
jgi:hypothetical protein